MILKNRICFGLLAATFCVLGAPMLQADDAATGSIVLEQCELSLPQSPISAKAECGTFVVAENPADPDGRQITLNLARVPAAGRSAEPDPVFLFAGGPGQAATEAWLLVAGALRKVNENRDIILIDQRGTGKSNPLKCPEVELEDALSDDWGALEDITRDCLASIDGDPRFYTTTIGMQDYDAVREALGYEQINLWGASYGTRAAQVYMKMFPERVRSAVLDSIVPQALPLGIDHAVKLDQAIFKVLRGCQSDPDCNQAFPGVVDRLIGLVQSLERQPVETTIDHPLTGEPFTMTYGRDTFAASVRFLMYSADTQAMLPLLIYEAAETGDFSRLASQMLISTAGLQDMIASGMELSVTCAEDLPWFPESGGRTGLVMGDTMVEATHVRCGVWPAGHAPDDFHDPLVSDKPVLLLSGELDPVTPPEYGDQVAAHLGNTMHVVAPGQGHSVTVRGCMGDIVAEFIETNDLDSLDTGCVSQMQASPYFISLTGPRP